MDPIFNKEVEDTERHLVSAYELAHQFGVVQFQDESRYIEQMRRLCKLKTNEGINTAALEAGKSAKTENELEATFNSVIKKSAKKNSAREKTELDKFKAELKSVADNIERNKIPMTSKANNESRMECDEFVMVSKINPIDPLSKQRMTDPVRNKKCGHRYERKNVLEAIKINERMRCPEMGCGNNAFVCKEDLEDDPEMKLQLQQTETEEDSLLNDDDDDDDD